MNTNTALVALVGFFMVDGTVALSSVGFPGRNGRARRLPAGAAGAANLGWLTVAVESTGATYLTLTDLGRQVLAGTDAMHTATRPLAWF